jgi:phage shock protein B
VAIVFGGTVLCLAIIGSTILMAIKIIKGGVSRKGQQTQADEAKIIQEIYQGLLKMEQRVEALETIILDRKERPS